MEIRDLVIEITRKCNMSCDHCLRGDQQKLDIDKKYVDSLLNQVHSIGVLTITGGEPTLNVEMIEYIYQKIVENNVDLGSFYIATNGLNVPMEFVIVCLKLYSYSYEKEMCRVDVSNDIYHEYEGEYNTELLEGLGFFGKKFEGVETYNYKTSYGSSLIREGRSWEGRKNEVRTIETKEEFDEDVIYLNCKGDIIPNCDLSYERQDEFVLCHVDEISEYYRMLIDG